MRIKLLCILLLVIISSGLNAQYPNILVTVDNEPNEPSICINPKDPNQMVAGSNTDNYHYSSNGGLTWNSGVLTSSLGVWGDPVVIADTAGNFLFFHLSVPSWPQWLDRIVCQKSVDGGQTWNKISIDQNLPDPVCEGTILNLGIKKGKHVLAFCNAADTLKRNNLTLRISYDEGTTWEKQILIDNSTDPKKKDFTAYSDIVKLSKNQIGVFYERDGYAQIVFTVINWNK